MLAFGLSTKHLAEPERVDHGDESSGKDESDSEPNDGDSELSHDRRSDSGSEGTSSSPEADKDPVHPVPIRVAGIVGWSTVATKRNISRCAECKLPIEVGALRWHVRVGGKMFDSFCHVDVGCARLAAIADAEQSKGCLHDIQRTEPESVIIQDLNRLLASI